MKLIKPVKATRSINLSDSTLNPFTEAYLRESFSLLSGWFPFSAEEMLQKYRNHDPRFRFSVTVREALIYVLFSLPWLDAEGRRILDIGNDDERTVSLAVGLAFDHEKEIIADLALYHLPAKMMHNQKIRNAFEEESDWLYWESYIIDEICLQDHELKDDEEVLIYTNAYTSRDERQRGIFTNLMELSESFCEKDRSRITLYSVISLDPDIACYGRDKQDEPYIYSMKNEPARLLNAEIIGKLGFEPLKLETDEEVEDGSLLWFAWKKKTVILLDPDN